MFSEAPKNEEPKDNNILENGGKKSVLHPVTGVPIRFAKTYSNTTQKNIRFTQVLMQSSQKKVQLESLSSNNNVSDGILLPSNKKLAVSPVSISPPRVRTVQVPSSMTVPGTSSAVIPHQAAIFTAGPNGLCVIRPSNNVRIVGTNRSLLSPVNAVVRSATGRQFIKLAPEAGQTVQFISRDDKTKNFVVVKRAGSCVPAKLALPPDMQGRQRLQVVDRGKNPRSLISHSYQIPQEVKQVKVAPPPMPRPKEPEAVHFNYEDDDEPQFGGVEDYLFGPSKKPRRPEISIIDKKISKPKKLEGIVWKPEESPKLMDYVVVKKDKEKEKVIPKEKEKVIPKEKEKVIPKEKQIEMSEEDKDGISCLEWDGGVGLLPGSDFIFKINEFGVLELDEQGTENAQSNQPKKRKLEKTDKKSDELVKCEYCGTYGMGSEFIEGKFCGNICQEEENAARVALRVQKQERTNKKSMLKVKRKQLLAQRLLLDGLGAAEAVDVIDLELQRIRMERELLKIDVICFDPTISERAALAATSARYVNKVMDHAAPSTLFKDPYPTSKHLFKVGMKLEAIDPVHPSLFCVCTIVEVQGFRMKLHFDGYPPFHDFWVNTTSSEIFHPGWCERTDHKLTPPRGYEGPFNWTLYLESNNASGAPRHGFSHPQEKTLTPSGFRAGMKLEAVDKKNSRLVCVASITDTIENKVLVHFDGWDDIYDYWADNSSPYIHPAGWCEENGYNLHPPPDYPKNFNWDEYTIENKGFTAPARAFKLRSPHEFKKGMKIEAVDKRNPSLVRIATIIDTEDHQLRIKFDGWPERFAYWIDDDYPDIHPVGWCRKTGHPLTAPPTRAELNPPSGSCPTPGCTGVGHAFNASPSHITVAACPYAPGNYLNEDLVPDRFKSTAEYNCAKQSSYSKGTKPRTLLSRKVRLLDHKKPSQKLKRLKSDPVLPPPIAQPQKSPPSPPPTTKTLPAKRQSPPPPSQPPTKKKIEEPTALIKFKKDMGEKLAGLGANPRAWTTEEVCTFIARFLNEDRSMTFEEHDIDGEALLMISQADLIEHLSFKLGPAIKLYNCIKVLRKQALQCQ